MEENKKELIKNGQYAKVVWQETPHSVRIIQGRFFDEGEFVRVEGNYKEVLIRTNKIISIEQKTRRKNE